MDNSVHWFFSTLLRQNCYGLGHIAKLHLATLLFLRIWSGDSFSETMLENDLFR